MQRSNPVTPKRKKSTRWWKVIDYLNALANAFSMGILFQAVARWIPAIRSLPIIQGLISDLIVLSDPLIYCTRGFTRILRLVGRHIFDIRFEEEKHGDHPQQAKGDIVVLALCALAVTTFFGALIPPPLNLAAAWVFGLSAVSVICYFDYIWPEQRLEKKLEKMRLDDAGDQKISKDEFQSYRNYEVCPKEENTKIEEKKIYVNKVNGKLVYTVITPAGDLAKDVLIDDPNISAPSEVTKKYLDSKQVGGLHDGFDVSYLIQSSVADTAHIHVTEKEYHQIKFARQLYIATIASLVMLLVFGHMMAAIPVAWVGVHVALDIISKVGSLFLGVVNLARFGNSVHPTGFKKAVDGASNYFTSGSTKDIANQLQTKPSRSSSEPTANHNESKSDQPAKQSQTIRLEAENGSSCSSRIARCFR